MERRSSKAAAALWFTLACRWAGKTCLPSRGSNSLIYIYIYVCVCVCDLHVHVYIYIYICICTRAPTKFSETTAF